MLPYQAYYSLYKDQIYPRVCQAYKDYVAGLHPGELQQNMTTFMIRFVEELYATVNDPDIRARVAQRCQRMD